MDSKTFQTMDEYIAQYPPEIREKLEELRKVIRESAPNAEETIAYRMPAFKLDGRPLVYFAPFKDHIGFFPTASGVEVFKDELTGFKTSEGTIQFPLDKPMPMDLVRRIVKFKITETLKSAEGKSKKKK